MVMIKKERNEIRIISFRRKLNLYFFWKYNSLLYVVINLNIIKAKVFEIRDRTSCTKYRSIVKKKKRSFEWAEGERMILAEKYTRL